MERRNHTSELDITTDSRLRRASIYKPLHEPQRRTCRFPLKASLGLIRCEDGCGPLALHGTEMALPRRARHLPAQAWMGWKDPASSCYAVHQAGADDWVGDRFGTRYALGAKRVDDGR